MSGIGSPKNSYNDFKFSEDQWKILLQSTYSTPPVCVKAVFLFYIGVQIEISRLFATIRMQMFKSAPTSK